MILFIMVILRLQNFCVQRQISNIKYKYHSILKINQDSILNFLIINDRLGDKSFDAALYNNNNIEITKNLLLRGIGKITPNSRHIINILLTQNKELIYICFQNKYVNIKYFKNYIITNKLLQDLTHIKNINYIYNKYS